MEQQASAAALCQVGKEAFFHHDGDESKRNMGLQLLLEAKDLGDPEAMYLVAQLLLDGVLRLSKGDTREHAMLLMCMAADKGWLQARTWLNRRCLDRYGQRFPKAAPVTGPLVDFDGEPIVIDRTGLRTPVDAVLTYENGKNILTLSANVQFLYTEEPENAQAFESTVLAGFREWSGNYTVFGGQQLTVRVELSREEKFYDHLTVIPMSRELNRQIRSMSRLLGNEQKARIMEQERSFAAMGRNWRTTSRKSIWLQGAEDPVVLLQTAKHEFGHVLGLGDLYESESDSLSGVAPGTYPELDSYAVTDKVYHLVMCTGAGPVSNNDIEMVVLAFRENRAQLYQNSILKGGISEALGKGN